MTSLLEVTSIVLGFGHTSDTLRCVAALGDSTYRHHRILVVENSDAEADLEALRDGLDGIEVIATGSNLGYAGGNNVGLSRALDAGADAVFVVNPDIVVESTALERLVETLVDRPSAGIVGPRVLNGGSDPTTIWFDGATLDLDRGGATAHVNSGRVHVPGADSMVRPTDYVAGSSMLVRTTVLRRIGLLPEDYFLYFEETDFNLRARSAGWGVYVVEDAVAHHHRRSMGRLPTPTYVYYFVRGRLLFARRFAPNAEEVAIEDLRRSWIDPWRARVAERAPHWVATFDELVAMAIDDAGQGRVGRRDDVHRLDAPEES